MIMLRTCGSLSKTKTSKQRMSLALNVIQNKSSVFCRKKFCHLGRTAQEKFGQTVQPNCVRSVTSLDSLVRFLWLTEPFFQSTFWSPFMTDIWQSNCVVYTNLWQPKVFSINSIGCTYFEQVLMVLWQCGCLVIQRSTVWIMAAATSLQTQTL